MGDAAAQTREISWRDRRLHVSIVPQDGETAVRVSLSTKRAARWTFAASLLPGFALGPALGALLNTLLRMPGPAGFPTLSGHAIDVVSVFAGLGITAGWSVIARAITRRVMERRERDVGVLSDAIVAKVRDGIDE
jgi:hypothetical protein